MPGNTALLVIDMQVGMFDEPRFDADAVTERLNTLGGELRAAGGSVIFVQHDGPAGDPFHPSARGWPLCEELGRERDDAVVHKTTCDAFYATNLQNLLDERGVKRLWIGGCATDFCVDTTLRAAVSRDFGVTAIEDGHTTADRPELGAESVIRHHNWVWQNLIAPGAGVEVRTARALIERLRGDVPREASA
jgi:nicotinamidase-related amidase